MPLPWRRHPKLTKPTLVLLLFTAMVGMQLATGGMVNPNTLVFGLPVDRLTAALVVATLIGYCRHRQECAAEAIATVGFSLSPRLCSPQWVFGNGRGKAASDAVTFPFR